MTDQKSNAPTTTATGGLNLAAGAPPFGETILGGEAPLAQERQLRDAVAADKHGWWWGVGRRKNAVARIRMKNAQGQGEIRVQKTRKLFKSIDDYFSEPQDRADCLAPLRLTDTDGKLDIVVRVHGGGHTGQAQAIRLAIARALRDYDPTLEEPLRDRGFLTVDDRRVERKKPGQPGARKRFQFSKR
jgi:small subunit ribosomal protein S9